MHKTGSQRWDESWIVLTFYVTSLLYFAIEQYLIVEFAKIARATGVGFLIMGFVGFFVKLIHIPINNIIVGGM